MVELIRFIKYLVIAGIAGTPIYFGSLYLLTEFLGIYYLLSSVIGQILAGITNYILNHYYTFKFIVKKSPTAIGGFKFVTIKVLGDFLFLGFLALFTEVFGIWYILSAILAICLTVPPGYILISYLVWNHKVWKTA